MLQFLICYPSRCGSFSSSSSQTPSAGMIVQAAFFSACFFCTTGRHEGEVMNQHVVSTCFERLHVTSADEAERDRWLESVLRQTARDFRKAELRVMGADEAETVDTLRYLELVVCEQAQLLRKLAPLRSPNGFFDF
ncbi:hypothetical protein ACFX13_019038 [Malus domestica]